MPSAALEAVRRRDARVQLGTLGRGNHFVEFQRDQDDGRLWLMVHSGSRAMGQAVRDLHLERATVGAGGLRHLDASSPAGRAYLADAEYCRRYAAANRRAMVIAISQMMGELLGVASVEGSYIECDHNHVRAEMHLGRTLWVHRKGAMSASADELGIIPGSMGTQSYHVSGRGCVDALRSSSHGAGRAMSRDEARRRISTRELDRMMHGIWFDHRAAEQMRDEAPAAYKDIRRVMRAQRDLTRIVRTLKPVLCYKGM